MRRPEFVARHGRRPEGWFGRLIATIMAWETSQENHVALELLEIHRGDRVLEIGVGHGRSMAEAARLTHTGLVAGIDFSRAMVVMARRRNREAVSRGLVDLREGDSARLPFEDGSFDRAFSVHTVYFWSRPVEHLREVRRVLKEDGRFVLGFRPHSEQAARNFPASVYAFRSANQICEMLSSAGFQNVALVNRGDTARGIIFAVCSGDQDTR